ncbi:glycoprotein precursor [Anopheles triannulatus orthophasmavirus]|uniref:Glycoprotein n=3 Tax=root TaxID=1 RepID=A0A481XUG4_9VIRU|nr:glycoprotein precursor [Anopheles triannulatus orthophasmavirus]QBK47218.1 glycoprotein precursor [Anopheles triannulatus orthophasmavirus]
MGILSLMLIIPLLTTVVYSNNGYVSVHDGEVRLSYKGDCEIMNNGHNMTFSGPSKLPGLYYGLINYRCGDNFGAIVSKIECKSCGLFCKHNDMITGCEQNVGKLVAGVITGLIVCLLVFMALRKPFRKFIEWVLSYIMFKYVQRQDKIEMERVDRLKVRTDFVVSPAFMTLPHMMPEHERRTIESRANMHRENVNARPKLYTMAVAMMALLVVCDACDNTLFVQSNGKICDSNGCIDSSMYDIPLLTGSVICFKDYKSDIMKIKIEDAKIRTRYNLVYHTSEYIISADSKSNCKGSGDCWNKGCDRNSVNPELVKLRNGTIVGYGCESNSLGCDDWCFHKTSCTWYKWSILTIGDLANVYEKSAELWEVTIAIHYEGKMIKHKVNINNPRVNLNGLMDGVPLYITSFDAETVQIPNGLLLYKNEGYQLKTSTINMPETDIIGDYQISLDKKTYAINEHNIDCKVESCRVLCRAPESKMTRFIRSREKALSTKVRSIGDMYKVETQRKVSAVVRVLIGNVNLNNLQVERAQCKIEMIGTYSCIGCSQDSYAIFQAHNIKSEGILPFNSNCSFSKDYLSCSESPYELTLTTMKKSCYIYIPSTNDTLYINFDFSFKGALDPSKPIYNVESEVEIMKSVMTSQSFITGLLSTFTMFGMASIIMSVILRVLQVVEFKKLNKEVNDLS